MINYKEKMAEHITQTLSLDLKGLYYAEQGVPPSSFKGELQYVPFPSYAIILSGELKKYMITNGEWKLETIPEKYAVFTISNAFSSPVHGAESLGVVLRPDFFRIIYADTTSIPYNMIKYPYDGLSFPFYYYHIYDCFRPATAGVIQTMELLAKEKDDSEINLKLLRISLEMLLQDLQNSQNYQGNAFETFRQIIHFVYEHHLEDIGRSDLADYFNISSSYVSKLFKRFKKNEDFSNYLINLRLDSAAKLLLYKNIPIKEIAFRCSFNSFSYFIKRFKMKFGMTPANYRKSNNLKIIN